MHQAVHAILVIIFACVLATVVQRGFPGQLGSLAHSIRSRVYHFDRAARKDGSVSKRSTPLPAVSKESDFPPDWFNSASLYELERRAILSKTWLHVTHRSLFKDAGDYKTFSIAGFNFVLILGKDNRLRGFHNVCRHRAYDVCTKSEGNSLIMRCRYHGWTYDSQGKLMHAPKFDGAKGFSKRENGLFEVRNWIDSSGFVYVNFDVYGSDGLTIRVGIPLRASLTLIESWSCQAAFNWKVAMPSGVFQVSSLVSGGCYTAMLKGALGWSESWKWPVEHKLSPLTRLLISSNGTIFLTISIVPDGYSGCSIVCALYTSAVGVKFSQLSGIRRDIQDSIKKLALRQDATNSDIVDLVSQEPLLHEVRAHARLEQLMGTEVHPASRLKESSGACKIADDLCRELDAADEANLIFDSLGRRSGLDW